MLRPMIGPVRADDRGHSGQTRVRGAHGRAAAAEETVVKGLTLAFGRSKRAADRFKKVTSEQRLEGGFSGSRPFFARQPSKGNQCSTN
jgi:hypothetical protein